MLKDVFNQTHNSMQITRAQAKLIKYKDVTQLALQWLQNEEGINIDSLCAPSDNCPSCESDDSHFKKQLTMQAQRHQLKLAEERCKQWMLHLMQKEAKHINPTGVGSI